VREDGEHRELDEHEHEQTEQILLDAVVREGARRRDVGVVGDAERDDVRGEGGDDAGVRELGVQTQERAESSERREE
jgi:hypothetical protein